ncbi:MAG: hypothetical protein AAF317_14325 [Pseudomonadota bacterium]
MRRTVSLLVPLALVAGCQTTDGQINSIGSAFDPGPGCTSGCREDLEILESADRSAGRMSDPRFWGIGGLLAGILTDDVLISGAILGDARDLLEPARELTAEETKFLLTTVRDEATQRRSTLEAAGDAAIRLIKVHDTYLASLERRVNLEELSPASYREQSARQLSLVQQELDLLGAIRDQSLDDREISSRAEQKLRQSGTDGAELTALRREIAGIDRAIEVLQVQQIARDTLIRNETLVADDCATGKNSQDPGPSCTEE